MSSGPEGSAGRFTAETQRRRGDRGARRLCGSTAIRAKDPMSSGSSTGGMQIGAIDPMSSGRRPRCQTESGSDGRVASRGHRPSAAGPLLSTDTRCQRARDGAAESPDAPANPPLQAEEAGIEQRRNSGQGFKPRLLSGLGSSGDCPSRPLRSFYTAVFQHRLNWRSQLLFDSQVGTDIAAPNPIIRSASGLHRTAETENACRNSARPTKSSIRPRCAVRSPAACSRSIGRA
jgi:hypothetical protein